ncbi:DeoR family transcriptional regulator [Thomasclavelia sp.]|nr:DeoR family transcriptional regulator [Thomasclavelia sp.]
MIPKERQDAILETLNNKGYISVEELSKNYMLA